MRRDAAQGRALTWCVGGVLAGLALPLLLVTAWPAGGASLLLAGFVSLTFGAVVWALRAATAPAAVFGVLICFLISGGTIPGGGSVAHSGLLPLMLLFVLTFGAGKLGRRSKVAAEDEAEERHGRRAAQIIANLGAAAVAASAGLLFRSSIAGPVLMLAMLAEATADTMSSEIGSAYGGTPILLTTFRRVPAGTDGAISLVGTLAGLAGAAALAAAGAWWMGLPPAAGLLAFLSGAAGLFVDSLLGATVERRGWLGNDLVNFASTVAAGLCALGVLLI